MTDRGIAYFSVTVVDKDVPCAVVFQVGDLQAAGVADLRWLESGIEGLNFHHRLWIPGLNGDKQQKGRCRFHPHETLQLSTPSPRLHPAC